MKSTFALSLLILAINSSVVSAQVTLDDYNIVWNSQSKNSSESMPCGGGDIGLNVWVEGGELLMYVSRNGTFDENNTLLKLGRLRIKMMPNPFEGSLFEQKLMLRDGYVQITASHHDHFVSLDVWVDVFNPVAHIEIKSNKPVTTEAVFESWRHRDRVLHGKENNANSYKWAPQGEVKTTKDKIDFIDSKVLFYHRNKEFTVFDVTVKQQGLDSVKNELKNPLGNLTFGGILQGDGMRPSGVSSGKYQGTDFQGWKLRSAKAVRRQNIDLYCYVEQTKTIDHWKTELFDLIRQVELSKKNNRKKTQAWWHQFWGRSFISIYPDSIGQRSSEWQAGRNYQLFRYMLGCNAFGKWPTKFNGGLFTYDPVFTDTTLNFTPDHRNWGGGIMTAQNQRLVYFPMLKSGDHDLMIPQFNFYLRTQRNAELRSQVYWKHNGACFTEQIEIFGLPNSAEYGWNRPPDFDKGVEYNAWLEYQWDTVFEFCLMILETERYFGNDIKEYIPLIESCLTFFDEHYQYRATSRGRNVFDGNGDLILYPGSATETYKMAYNATPTIAALRTILTRLLQLRNYLSADQIKKWSIMLDRIPPIAFSEFNDHKTIAPARSWERINHQETPQLYPVFPWGLYGIGQPDLDVAINTWRYDTNAVKFRSHKGWKQDNIFAARLGLTKEASELTVLKLKDSGRRFPAFWGPGFDWTPDHNWGGSGMIGLQEMLLQASGDSLYLFPAWPKEWDVHFKLHAPKKTVVEGVLKKGKILVLRVTPAKRRNDVVICPF